VSFVDTRIWNIVLEWIPSEGNATYLRGWGKVFRDFFPFLNVYLHRVLTAGKSQDVHR